jgi:hypothetical protein
MGDERKVYRILVGKPEGKTPLGRPRRRWECGIRLDLTEMDWGCKVYPVGSGQGPMAVSCCMNLRVLAPWRSLANSFECRISGVCEISGSYNGEYEDDCLLEFCTIALMMKADL